MSSAWAGGSNRRWRALRLYVLERDGWRCQVPIPGRQPPHHLDHCDRYADTAGHIIAKAYGGIDQPGNLRAECRAHNFTEGGRLAHVRATIRRWSW